MEFILTASPEWFPRDQDGQAQDVRGGQWVADNLRFLQRRYGEPNVVSFTLHQDEKTPHIHAVVIPITKQGRLSADTLFNPLSLKQLQTDYANAMAGHGLERGIEGSRRPHLEMKQMYGLQELATVQLAPLAQPTVAKRFVLDMPPLLGREAWKDAQEARINAEITRQVGEADRRAQEAAKVAIANVGAKEHTQGLERQLRAS